MFHERIAPLNNRGVECLAAGYDDDAINHFRVTLGLLKKAMKPPPSQNVTMDIENISQMTPESTISYSLPVPCVVNQEASRDHVAQQDGALVPCEIESSSCHLPSIVKLDGLQQDSFAFIYSRPFVFVNHDISTGDIHSLLPLHSAVVIFNLALAHHRQGKVTRRRKILDKAILLYGMCLRILGNAGWQAEIAVLVDAAAMNNLAQLYFEIDDHFDARNRLDQLSTLLFGTSCFEILAHIDEEALQGFLLNMLLLKPSNVALAA